MALRSASAPLKALFHTQKRGYAVQATVEKIVLDPSRPIGSVSYLFSKHSQHVRELQQQISLKAIAHGLTSIHSTVANGGDAALAHLETAQKIVSSPTLMAQFKKDVELSKKATVRAVAWLKDLRTEKEAQDAAAKIDAHTKALLEKTVAFAEIVPLRSNVGLNLNIKQTATVADWWLAYGAAITLAQQGKTYSTLTGQAISAESEKALAAAASDRVARAVTNYSRSFVASQADLLPAVVTYGAQFGAATSGGSSHISLGAAVVNEAAAIPVNQFTVKEIVQLLSEGRTHLRKAAQALVEQADELATASEASLLSSSWATLSAAASKADVDAATSFIKANNAKANGTVATEWEAVVAATLPTEHKALTAALEKLAAVVTSIPQNLLDAEVARRASVAAAGQFASTL